MLWCDIRSLAQISICHCPTRRIKIIEAPTLPPNCFWINLKSLSLTLMNIRILLKIWVMVGIIVAVEEIESSMMLVGGELMWVTETSCSKLTSQLRSCVILRSMRKSIVATLNAVANRMRRQHGLRIGRGKLIRIRGERLRGIWRKRLGLWWCCVKARGRRWIAEERWGPAHTCLLGILVLSWRHWSGHGSGHGTLRLVL